MAGEATVTYGYDLTGRLTGVGDNSTALLAPTVPAGPFSTLYTYDVLNRMTGANWSPTPDQVAPAAASVTFTHAYTRTNQRAGQTVSDSTWLLYPPAVPGSITYTTNALNQYTGFGGAAPPTYDGNGNLTFDGRTTFAYDAENRLLSMTQPPAHHRHQFLQLRRAGAAEDLEFGHDDGPGERRDHQHPHAGLRHGCGQPGGAGV